MNNQSIIYKLFKEALDTASFFKNTPQAYLTIKTYAFNNTNQLLQTGQGQFFPNEKLDFDNQYNFYNQEIMSVGGQQNAFMNKENYENFLVQNFSSVNFDTCDKATLSLTNNLINVLGMYGPIQERFASHKKFVMFRIAQFNSMEQVQNKPEVSISNNNTSLTTTTTTTTKTTKSQQPKVSVKIGAVKDFKELINQNIKLPIKKGSQEYEQIKDIVKEHLMLAEQEALYNNMTTSQAHIEVALYYLKNIQEQ